MKIRLELDGKVLEYDKPPMPESRFKALCWLFAVGCYVGMVVCVTAICGFLGLVVVGSMTLLLVMVYTMSV